MNPVQQSASSPGGKSLNTAHNPTQQQQSQIISPSFESNTRRSGSQSGGVSAAARNNQSQRKQHRNSKKPRLADEDAMAESVSCTFLHVPIICIPVPQAYCKQLVQYKRSVHCRRLGYFTFITSS